MLLEVEGLWPDSVDNLVDSIWSDLREPPVDPEDTVRAVFEVMWDNLDPGEIVKVIETMPKKLRELWPLPARAY